MRAVIDVQEVCACVDSGSQSSSTKYYDIVVSNVKIADKDPRREYDHRMWDQLAALPYSIAVVPRHPLIPDQISKLPKIPENVGIMNRMGVLRDLCAHTRLVIMGLIFSKQQ
ncbi:MAG: hypothetical protein ACOYN2_06125 [Patescibacteria group bacterium]